MLPKSLHTYTVKTPRNPGKVKKKKKKKHWTLILAAAHHVGDSLEFELNQVNCLQKTNKIFLWKSRTESRVSRTCHLQYLGYKAKLLDVGRNRKTWSTLKRKKNDQWNESVEMTQMFKSVEIGKQVAQWRTCLPMQETKEMRVWSLGGKIPWRRTWQPTPVFLPGESHGQRSLTGCSPWGRKESDTTEHTHPRKTCW